MPVVSGYREADIVQGRLGRELDLLTKEDFKEKGDAKFEKNFTLADCRFPLQPGLSLPQTIQLVLTEPGIDTIQNKTGNEPIRLAQNAAVKETKSSNTPAANVDSKGVILKGYDPVAYFKQVKALKGNPTIESNYQGVTYLFASTQNKAVFDKDPAEICSAVWRVLCLRSS